MSPAGLKVVARWREAGEWWRLEPQREFVRRIDPDGVRREESRQLPTLAVLEESGQRPLEEDHSQEWALRERKIRDEKVSAALNALPPTYYDRLQAEKAKAHQPSARERVNDYRPDLRPAPVLNGDRRFEEAWKDAEGGIVTASIQKRLGYVPLHVRSGYSFGRSTILAEEIAALAACADCPAAAIADIHSLAGAWEFVRACRRNGIKPIVGAAIELPEGGEIVLFARSKRGYISLSRLITECHLQEPRNYPLGSWERIERHSADLICLTGGDAGKLNQLLAQRKFADADELVLRLVAIYGRENVLLEVERTFLPWQISVESHLHELAERHGLVECAGGMVTHARPWHFPAQDVLVCAESLCLVDEILGRKPPRDPGQPAAPRTPERAMNAERYLRTSAEMQALYSDRPDLLQNTWRVSERCDEDVMPARARMPSVTGNDSEALWEKVMTQGRSVYPEWNRLQQNRLRRELKIITENGFASHFLVAADFCDWAREQHIQFSGRGSVVDAAVSHVLGFSRIDAIRHKLHFDRFLPPDGTKRPDIDIDFEARRRDDVRGYVIRKYGIEHTAAVCAFGAYCTRGIVREVGKALGLPSEVIGFLSKRIHGGVPPDQIEAALDKKPELRASNIDRERFRWVFRLADRLMDVPRNIRVHSSGVIVSADPIRDVVPVMWSASGGADEDYLRLAQWDKRSIKHCYDKFDILCLRGQDVLSGTETRVRQNEPAFRADTAPIDDEETYRAMRSGELIGIPQSASPAMRQAHVRMRTKDLDDASLVQAGIRPGVGGAVKLNEMIARRRGKPFSFAHPDLAEILGHTWGIIVFQEQVDQLLQTFCGYTAGQAEDIRDAIHKRRREDFGSTIRDVVIERVQAQGYERAVAEEVYNLVSGFKGYGFAQGHALAFAEVSIRSIWCQQNYPAEYFAALLSAQPAGYYGPCTIVNEARTRGVPILPVDVNRSELEFSVEDVYTENPRVLVPGAGIRVGLEQVAGVSKGTKLKVVERRRVRILTPEDVPIPLPSVSNLRVAQAEAPEPPPLSEPGYSSLFDFVCQVKPDRDELENLILCGALDSICPNRRAALWAIPAAMDYAKQVEKAGQPELPLTFREPKLPAGIGDFDDQERAVHERRLLGLDVRHHLMAFERERIASRGGISTDVARRLPNGRKAFVVGNPIRLRFPPTPSGKRVVFFDLEDETGLLNVTCFDDTYQKDGHTIVCSPYVTVIGEAQDRDGHTAFLGHRVFPYHPTLLNNRREVIPIGVADFLVG